ncbi:hypothetical protein BGW80DRAFT_303173 [Lactifluus volemus]|nr:hypothetical protein BGW80DRAFT_303173 [Lactifluus volemus]
MQVSAPNCTLAYFDWTFNSLRQNPCLVAAQLAATCNNGVFSIPPLFPMYSYSGPSGPDDSDLCKCNTVVYNLVSACDACQGSPWVSYSTWTYNCTTVALAGTFSEAIPVGTQIPRWAFVNPVPSDTWVISAAQLAGTFPEVTGTTSTSTHTPTPTPTPTPQTSIKVVMSSHVSLPLSLKKNSSAAIGGIIGGIISAVFIIAVVVWLIIRLRRRSTRFASTSTLTNGKGSTLEPEVSLAVEVQTFYDFSDPGVYPMEVKEETSRTPSNDSSSEEKRDTKGQSELSEV